MVEIGDTIFLIAGANDDVVRSLVELSIDPLRRASFADDVYL